MKKFFCAALALTLCLSAAFADDEIAVGEIVPTTPPAATEPPAAEPEPEQAPVHQAETNPVPVDDMMFPKGSEPLIMAVPDISAHAEGYIENGNGRTTGTLEELLSEPGRKTVFVSSKEPVRIEKFRLSLLKDVEFLPDAGFGEGYVVAVATEKGEIAPMAIEADEEVTLIISVEKQAEDETGDPDGTGPEGGESGGDDDAELKLKVTPRSFTDGEWQNEIPSFLLEGIPEGNEDCVYAAIIYDERIVPLAGDEYFAQEEGTYVVRFAILDALGDIADKSEKYLLMLDFTEPELAIEVSAEHDYTMTLSASDLLSGVIEFSLDGGESWTPLNEGESIVHTEARRKVFAPGMIQVRDQAGNVAMNLEEVVLDAIPKEPAYMGGWSGGGSGEPSPTAAPHASGNGDAAPYDAYELALPEGPVEVLTLGGEELDLSLELTGEDIPEDEPALFTAELTAWAVENPLDSELEPEKNTLVVRAEAGEAEEPYTCTWRINGAVLRKLYNTDITYLALAAGDAVLSLPTIGFTAGTRYAELKMEGVSTAEFDYEIVLHIDPNADAADFVPAENGWILTGSCVPEIHAEVAGERFDMIDRLSTPEMYPIDVYCGPADLPEYPYGAYPRAETEDEQ